MSQIAVPPVKQSRRALTFRTLKYYLSIIAGYKYRGMLNVFCVGVATVLGNIVVGYYLARLLQQLGHYVTGTPPTALYGTLWAIAVIKLTEVAFWRVNDYTTSYRIAMVLRDLEQFVFRKLQFHSYRFFADSFAGSLVAQATRFFRSYQELEQIFFFELWPLLLKIVFSVGVLLFMAPVLGIILLLWSVGFIASVTWLTIKKSSITRTAAKADTAVTAGLADVFTNMVNVKIFARHRYEQVRFNALSQDRFKKRWRSYLFDAHIRSYRWVLLLALYLMFIWISVHLVTTGQATAVAVTTAQIYVLSLYSDLFSLNQTVQRIEEAFSEAAEMTEILDLEPEVKDPIKPEKPRINAGKVVFDNVSFRYTDTSNDVLTDFSLHIPSGQKVGLVGHSGSGKSTMTRLLMRFADLQRGQITLDGQNIAAITQTDLREQTAFVPQEPILFHRTLMENIRYGRDNATDQEVFQAAQLAHATDFINTLPAGYDTLVGERGIKLSGGEKQRVAIARAMLSRAPLLILDEATSALDSKSEKLITSALDNLMKKRTTIVIAHRLSTIRKMDRILVLKNGEIVEDGTHEELLKQQGEYAELWSHQSGGFLED